MSTQRSDAAARRVQLLDAADAVFTEHGINAPLDLVVEQAGLGRATLYRNFPDRSALIEALLQRTIERIEAHVLELGERDDALFELLHAMAMRIVKSPAVADYWRAVDINDSAIRSARQRIRDLMTPALQRAIAAGLCRPDLQPNDISLYSSMLGAALRGRSHAERARLAKRAMELLDSGLWLAPMQAKLLPSP